MVVPAPIPLNTKNIPPAGRPGGILAIENRLAEQRHDVGHAFADGRRSFVTDERRMAIHVQHIATTGNVVEVLGRGARTEQVEHNEDFALRFRRRTRIVDVLYQETLDTIAETIDRIAVSIAPLIKRVRTVIR